MGKWEGKGRREQEEGGRRSRAVSANSFEQQIGFVVQLQDVPHSFPVFSEQKTERAVISQDLQGRAAKKEKGTCMS